MGYVIFMHKTGKKWWNIYGKRIIIAITNEGEVKILEKRHLSE